MLSRQEEQFRSCPLLFSLRDEETIELLDDWLNRPDDDQLVDLRQPPWNYSACPPPYLVKPIQANRYDLVSRYQGLFQHPGIAVVPFDLEAASSFAAIRQDKRIRPPDAIQMACAAAAGTDLFITNDDRLSKLHVPNIQFLSSLDQAPI